LKSPEREVLKFYGNTLDSFRETILDKFQFTKVRLFISGLTFGVGSLLLILKGLYGRGVYFSSDPVLSARKCNHDYVLLCRVVIGKYWTIHCSGISHF
jgi:hypothetical protein